MDMKITIRKNNEVMSSAEMRNYIMWLGENLMSKKTLSKISLKVEIKHVPGCKAAVMPDEENPSQFLVELSPKLGKYELMKALAHEMVHVKQFATGELYQYIKEGFRYQGKKYPDSVEYYDQPWEIEAYGREVGLYRRYLRHLRKMKKLQK